MVVIRAMISSFPSPSRSGTSYSIDPHVPGLFRVQVLPGAGGLEERCPGLALTLGFTSTDR